MARRCFIAAIVAVLTAPAVLAAGGPQAKLDTGIIEGALVNGTRQWRGVPYAAPPVGPLRWKPPGQAASWTGVKVTTQPGNVCQQPSDPFTLFRTVSEDCLYLEVYAPGDATRAKLPVMLFFFGGSWKYGAGSFFAYDGVPDVDFVADVIIVTINYRLGAFGFMGSAALSAEDPEGGSGNYGLQDQRAAMQWVQRNAAAFGGDPDNVMIFGESAGAGSVSAHLVNERSKGLFHRALMESGPIAPWTAQPMNTSQAKYDALARNVDCDKAGTPAQVLDCMRKLNGTYLQAASQHGLPSGFLEWSPTVDGVEFSEYPQQLAAAGKFPTQVPVLLGTNRDEGTLFAHAKSDWNQTQATEGLINQFGHELTTALLKVYKYSDFESPYWMVTRIVGDGFMTCPARRTARALSKAGMPVFQYFFQHELEVIKLFKPDYGVCHASELAFVWDLKIGLWGKGEPELAEQFMTYWTRMAANGNPNTPIPGAHGHTPPPVIEWPVYNATTDETMVLDIPLATQAGLKKQYCDFWDTVPIDPYQLFSGTHPPV